MKIIKIIFIFMMLLSTQTVFFAAENYEICDPHLSIENQRDKKISEQAQKLLVKIIADQISFQWPVKVCKSWISSLFGPRKSGYHHGLDLAASQGTPVYASADGIVQLAEHSSDTAGYGNMILIKHQDLNFYDDFGRLQYYKTRYGHLHRLFVQKGDRVKVGDKIGLVGSTGHVVAKHSKSDPSHLHFEVYRGEHRINPLICLFASDEDWVEKNLAGYKF